MARLTGSGALLLGSLLAACGPHGDGNAASFKGEAVATDAATPNKTAAPDNMSTAGNNMTVANAAADAANACARVKTSGWKAWVDAMPGPGAGRTLHVEGSATVPTGGWKLMLKEGALTKSLPPTQMFDFIATPPSGAVIQVVHSVRVNASITPAQLAYKSVEIRCGRTTVASLKVTTAS